jgi:4'-phosphopantetheinyl transferase
MGHDPAEHWPVLDQTPPLLPEVAHVWRFSLDRPLEEIETLREVCSEDERTRADRYLRPHLRLRFAAGRGVLRTILGLYLRCSAHEIAFTYNGYGKPDLAGDAASSGLKFNLSHSAGQALLAVCNGRAIGVDIEELRPEVNCQDLSTAFFSAREVADLKSVPEQQRREAFFHCWTRKEAYIKARGQGLTLPLDKFDMTLLPGVPAELLAARDAPEEVLRWSVASLAPAPGFVGALVVERPLSVIRQCAWPEPAATGP